MQRWSLSKTLWYLLLSCHFKCKLSPELFISPSWVFSLPFDSDGAWELTNVFSCVLVTTEGVRVTLWHKITLLMNENLSDLLKRTFNMQREKFNRSKIRWNNWKTKLNRPQKVKNKASKQNSHKRQFICSWLQKRAIFVNARICLSFRRQKLIIAYLKGLVLYRWPPLTQNCAHLTPSSPLNPTWVPSLPSCTM